MVFAVEAGVMLVLPHLISPAADEHVRAMIDATMLTLICAPVLWLIIIGPLRRIAISEQQRSETIVANAGEGILTADAGGRIQSLNRAAAEVFGGESHRLLGRRLGELLPEVDLASADLSQPVQCFARRVDGLQFPVVLTISRISSSAGSTFVVLVRDMTLAQRAEEQRMAAAREKEALRAQQMATLAQLATGVAHEIRNPLTSVKMLIQANREQLRKNGLPTEDLQLVEQEIRRMERSLNALLEFARPSPAERTRVDLRAVIDRTTALVEGRASSQGVRIHVDQSGQGALFVDADFEQLQQLFLNLSLNGLDAMPEGGTLSFDLRVVEGQAVAVVADTGQGIAPSVMDELFTPFVTSKPDGVGLGLGICRRIAEDHGGQLIAENSSTGGARFELRLPLWTADSRGLEQN